MHLFSKQQTTTLVTLQTILQQVFSASDILQITMWSKFRILRNILTHSFQLNSRVFLLLIKWLLKITAEKILYNKCNDWQILYCFVFRSHCIMVRV